jgi:hypothetical protein
MREEKTEREKERTFTLGTSTNYILHVIQQFFYFLTSLKIHYKTAFSLDLE